MIEIDRQAIVTRELRLQGSYGFTAQEFKRGIAMLTADLIPTKKIINRRVTLVDGPDLFDQLLASPNIIKCMINFV